VDGGSGDDTLKTAEESAGTIDLKTIQLKKAGIPGQLNQGASVSKGLILIFLHADCRLPAGALNQIKDAFEQTPGLAGGAFTMRVEGKRFFYRILSAGGDFFCRRTRTFFGDRGMFVDKKIFGGISGYKDLPVMSDVDFSIRMRKAGKVKLLKVPVISSSRKFENEPFYKVVYLMLWSIAAFKLGVDPGVIRKKYYGE
jgi:glycosyltransferase involved in cell wall biosynthesis